MNASSNAGRRTGGGERSIETPLETRRYLAAIRRSRWLILAIIAVVTGVVIALSLTLPKTYEADATVVLDAETGVLDTPDPVTVQRRLETANALIGSTEVLERAAEEVPGATPDSIDGAITSTVDQDANLITITAAEDTPRAAAATANAMADAFLREQQALEREGFANAREDLTARLNQLESDPAASEQQISALRARISDLGVEEVSAGTDLQLAEAATPPGSPASPRPFRNAILALFASAFLGVLVALGREQLRPGVSEPRELSRLFNRPVLASIPYIRRRRFSRRRHLISSVERELYQNLASTVQWMAPPGKTELILVTSAVHGEGKTTVTARLGLALAQAGHRTLLISADLRWPTLHTLFDVPLEPGISDVLELMEKAGPNQHVLPATVNEIPVYDSTTGDANLDLVTSGEKPTEPAHLMSVERLKQLFEHARSLDYSYVLIDAPPMLGVAESQALARLADRVLLVARPERVTLDKMVDVEELLNRLGANTLGLVVIGGRTDVSLYYSAERPPLVKEPTEALRSGASEDS
jgi:capsular exopolysaccharide synthesis family protein